MNCLCVLFIEYLVYELRFVPLAPFGSLWGVLGLPWATLGCPWASEFATKSPEFATGSLEFATGSPEFPLEVVAQLLPRRSLPHASGVRMA